MSASDIQQWTAPPTKELVERLDEQLKKKTGKRIASIWTNDGTFSPLDLYCYLKGRFGLR